MTAFLLAAKAPPSPDERLLAYLPAGRENRLSPAMPPERLSEVLTAYSLCSVGLNRFYGIPGVPEILYAPGGKPYFAQYPGIHLSLSHTRGLAVCALSARSIGVDAERIRPVGARLFARVCGDGPYDEAMFFREWTLREALCKLTGEGNPLKPRGLPAGAGFRHFEHGDYVVCVCGQDLPSEIAWI